MPAGQGAGLARQQGRRLRHQLASRRQVTERPHPGGHARAAVAAQGSAPGCGHGCPGRRRHRDGLAGLRPGAAQGRPRRQEGVALRLSRREPAGDAAIAWLGRKHRHRAALPAGGPGPQSAGGALPRPERPAGLSRCSCPRGPAASGAPHRLQGAGSTRTVGWRSPCWACCARQDFPARRDVSRATCPGPAIWCSGAEDAGRESWALLVFKALQLLHAPPQRDPLQDFVAFDLETTELDRDDCEVVDIAAVRVRGGRVVDQFQSLVRCNRPISAGASAAHGYTDADLVGQPVIRGGLAPVPPVRRQRPPRRPQRPAVRCAHPAPLERALRGRGRPRLL